MLQHLGLSPGSSNLARVLCVSFGIALASCVRDASVSMLGLAPAPLMPFSHIRHLFHMCEAVRNGNSCEEILSWRPWAASIADIQTEIARSAAPPTDELDPNSPPPPAPGATTGAPSSESVPTALSTVRDAETRDAIEQAADRLARRLVTFAVEPQSQTAISDLISSAPLANVKATSQTGNVMILLDCNTFGETDVQPDVRACPINQEVFKKWTRGILQGRLGTADPEALGDGDIFICIDGGRDRKRVFLKHLLNAKVGKDVKRTVCHTLMMHMTEKSWRQRRHHPHGRAHLTQQIHIAASAKTMKNIKHNTFSNHHGSTRGNVFGPVELDALDTIPGMQSSEKDTYLGKRKVAAGGKLGDEADEAEAEEGDEAEAESSMAVDEASSGPAPQAIPLSYHCLPLSVTTDLVTAYDAKHVLDFTPTPLNLATELAKRGISYFAVCGTEAQKTFLEQALHNGLIKELVDSNSPLGDPRFIQAVEPEPTTPTITVPDPPAPPPPGGHHSLEY